MKSAISIHSSHNSSDNVTHDEDIDPVIVHMISLDFTPCECPGIECVCGRLNRFLTIVQRYRENHPSIDGEEDDWSDFSGADIWPDNQSELSSQL